MFLAAHAPRVLAAGIQHIRQHRIGAEGRAVYAYGFLGHAEHADAFHVRRGAGEVFIHQHLGQTHRLKYLRAGVRHVGGDTHFGHHLAQALAHGLDEILDGFLAIHARAERALVGEIQQRFQRQIRMNSLRTVAAQQGEVMHLARRAGFNHQTRAGAQALVDEMLVNCRHREQRGDRHVVAIHLAVGDDNDRIAAAHRILGLRCQTGEACFNCLIAPRHRVGDIDLERLEFAVGVALDMTDFLHLVKIEHRLAHFQTDRRVGLVDAQEIGLRANKRHQRGHQLLANGVYRRVGHLREKLFEVVI